MKIALLLCCLLVAVINAKDLRRGHELFQQVKSITDKQWVMLPDNHGTPTLALLTGNPTTPETRDVNTDVKFHLYTSSNPSASQRLYLNDVNTLQASSFNPSNPTKIVIHGFTNDIDSDAIQSIKNAFLSVGSYNVIGVDWGVLAGAPLYNVAKDNSALVGAHLGNFIDFLVNQGALKLADLHLIGHSLGAHIAGIAGSTAAGTVQRVTGLDPALPLFANENIVTRLDANDAAFVDVIHTCGGLLGFMDAIGDADFYPNGGVTVQPGCGLIDATGSCSHGKSYELFSNSIINPDIYQSYQCSSVANAEIGNCNSFSAGLMGIKADPSMRGIFHLITQ